MRNYFFLLITIVLFSSCNSEKKQLNKLNWLEGTWQTKVEGNDVFETWQLQGDSIWVGKSTFVKNGKELFSELMSIHLDSGKMQFNSAVSNQNDAEQVLFSEISWEGNKVVFENKEHDFPQRVTYQLKNENELFAFISGDMNGKAHQIDFNFTKVK